VCGHIAPPFANYLPPSSSPTTDPGTKWGCVFHLRPTGDHAKAVCVNRKASGGTTVIRPEWHYFDNAWWQVDD
jgi:hypothetical protein